MHNIVSVPASARLNHYAISPHESAKLLHVAIVVSTILEFFQNHIQFVRRTVNQDNQENFV